MPEFEVLVTRTAHGTQSANVVNPGRPLLIIQDIPGPDGVPLMHTPWQLRLGDNEVAYGTTDTNGRVVVLAPLESGQTYELDYPGRTVQLVVTELAAIRAVEGLQQRLIHLGYDPGPDDGALGPRSKSALMEFQEDQALLDDGIYGPLSQEKLMQEFGE